jgi:hypothetical protein
MFLDHPRIAVTELRRDDSERNSLHGEPTRVGMAQSMEADFWLDPRRFAGCGQWPGLLGFLPRLAVVPDQ